MARTIYFPDGSCEVLFCGEHEVAENILALERILQERLGNDTVHLFQQIMEEYTPESNALNMEMRCYEQSCDGYRNRLHDVRNLLDESLAKLSDGKRLNRAKLTDALHNLMTTISSYL